MPEIVWHAQTVRAQAAAGARRTPPPRAAEGGRTLLVSTAWSSG
ncbi:MAG: hypothetical protein ABI611_22230 [Solirubrobacteraceae bacterium]